MVEVIRERTSMHSARDRAYIEWQTKILAGFIASTAQSEKGARALQKAASTLSMIPDEPSPNGTAQTPNVPDPRVGSFEKLSGLFGGRMTR